MRRRRGGRARLGGTVPRAAPLRRRGRPRDLRRQGLVDPAARRGDERARLRGGRRRGRGEPARPAVPRGNRCRRLGARDADAARDRGRRPRPALRKGRRRGHRVRAAGADGGPAPPRRAGRRRARGARSSVAVHARGDGAPRAVRLAGRDRARSASAARAKPRLPSPATEIWRWSPASRPRSTAWTRRPARAHRRLLESLRRAKSSSDANEPGDAGLVRVRSRVRLVGASPLVVVVAAGRACRLVYLCASTSSSPLSSLAPARVLAAGSPWPSCSCAPRRRSSSLSSLSPTCSSRSRPTR